VKVGDQVRQSDVIGTVGSSGDIERPLLHFSLEQEGIALNPVNFF
jgi:murein DD-endopeptidase MepM/ murein hydrolase activator NlpD